MPRNKLAYKATPELRKKVTQMSSVGIPQDDICKVLGICKHTLERHYREELDTASAIANASVGGKLYEKCMAGDTTALIFWAKTRMKWKETVVNENKNEISFEESLLAALKQ